MKITTRLPSLPIQLSTVARIPLPPVGTPTAGVDRFVLSSPPQGGPRPINPAHSFASVLQSYLERAVAEGSPPAAVINVIRGSYPRNVGVALVDRVRDFGTPVPDNILEALGAALRSDSAAAAKVVSSWRNFRYGPVLLSHLEYEQSTAWVRRYLKERLVAPMTPGDVERRLRNAPTQVLESFHNVVFGTKRDEPRLCAPALARKVYGESNERFIALAIDWENMWEALALRLGWEMKKRVHSDFYDIHTAIGYAKQKGWSPEQFRKWLVHKVEEVSEIRYILELFDSVVDLGQGMPQTPSFAIRVYYRWSAVFYELVAALGRKDKIRPKAQTLHDHSKRREAIADLEEIFAEAAEAPPAERAAVLRQKLVEAGLGDYVSVAQNVIAEFGEGERLPLADLNIPGTTYQMSAEAQRKVEPLARKYGFVLKERPKISVRRGSSRKLGFRFKEIFGEDPLHPPSAEIFLIRLREDATVKSLMAETHAPFVELFAGWIAYQRGENSVTKTESCRTVSSRTGITFYTVDGWWRIFDRWNGDKKWFTQI